MCAPRALACIADGIPQEVATPHLFSAPFLSSQTQIVKFASILRESHGLGPLVHTIYLIHFYAADPTVLAAWKDIFSHTPSLQRLLPPSDRRPPPVTRACVEQLGLVCGGSLRRISIGLHDGSLGSTSFDRFTELTTLSVSSSDSLTIEIVGTPSLRLPLPKLRTLELLDTSLSFWRSLFSFEYVPPLWILLGSDHRTM